MNARHVEAIGKLMEAKRLEQEALGMLIPEKMKKHLDVICGELSEMALEWLVDVQKDQKSKASEAGGSAEAVTSTQVKKVPIG